MKFSIKNIFNRKKADRATRIVRFGFDAAKITRWSGDFLSELGSINRELKNDLRAVRGRARNLWRNSAIVRAYRKRLISDVIGRDGFRLQMRCKKSDGTTDIETNNKIEAAWKEYCKKEYCTTGKTINMIQVCNQLIESYKRDGEFICRFIEQPDINKFGFSLELIEPDLLDEKYNTDLNNGNVIIMGVELNSWKQPQAYYFKKKTMTDELQGLTAYMGNYSEHKRIKADEILHLFDPEHSNQFRGISHLAPVMVDLHNLKAYDEAAIIAARVGASSTIIIETEKDEGYDGDAEDEYGPIKYLTHGQAQYLNPGEKVSPWTPNYPNEQYASFIKSSYRRIAVALGINYNSLLSDLENVNFSSMRSGLLMERDQWTVDQNFIITCFLEVIFSRWLKATLLNSNSEQENKILDLPYLPDIYDKPEFFGRTYPWVDPFKDVQATVLALNNNLTTLTRECKRTGIDIDDLIAERKEEIRKLKESGIPLGNGKLKPSAIVDNNPDEGNEIDIVQEIFGSSSSNPGITIYGGGNGNH